MTADAGEDVRPFAFVENGTKCPLCGRKEDHIHPAEVVAHARNLYALMGGKAENWQRETQEVRNDYLSLAVTHFAIYDDVFGSDVR